MNGDSLSGSIQAREASAAELAMGAVSPQSSVGADVPADDAVLERARTDRRSLFDLDRFTSVLAEAELDAVVAFSGPNVTYTGGAFSRGWDPLQMVVTTAGGVQVLVLPDDYAQYFGEYSWVSDIRNFAVGEDMFSDGLNLLADVLIELGLSGARIGFEGPLQADWSRLLAERLPNAKRCEAAATLERARLIKTAGEIAVFRVAVLRTQEAMRAAWAGSRPGDTEKQISARVQSAALYLGADAIDHCQLQAGLHSTVAMSASLERPALSGDVVHIDLGAVFAGYHTDLARNAVVGAASPAQASIYQRLAEVQQTLIDTVKAGVVAAELAELNQQAFARVGLQHPWGAIGHGTGLSVHEGFVISEGCNEVLEAGMLINLEPSHIEAGDARYHIEDTLVVTDSGCELLGALLGGPLMEVIR
ncbi:MAG: aminopeptidase P family protein [Actinobacteria bacterium]|nr:aminopeptidase P family protein [Actinomycetota bacterium]